MHFVFGSCDFVVLIAQNYDLKQLRLFKKKKNDDLINQENEGKRYFRVNPEKTFLELQNYTVSYNTGAASLTSIIIFAYITSFRGLNIWNSYIDHFNILTTVAVKLIGSIKTILNAITFLGLTDTLESISTQYFRAFTFWSFVVAINLIRGVSTVITTIARPLHTCALSIIASKLIWSTRHVTFWQKRWETKSGTTKFYAFA